MKFGKVLRIEISVLQIYLWSGGIYKQCETSKQDIHFIGAGYSATRSTTLIQPQFFL